MLVERPADACLAAPPCEVLERNEPEVCKPAAVPQIDVVALPVLTPVVPRQRVDARSTAFGSPIDASVGRRFVLAKWYMVNHQLHGE